MIKHNKLHSRRIKKLLIISVLTAIILSVSTYAWFVGMQSVNITSFDVEIEVADSLMLSLDGKRWSPELTISETTLDRDSYSGHTNKWGKLIPVSTIGEMDISVSRMKLFEKASYTATPGGYRLIASRVDNHTKPTEEEPNGYVVFDLFVRNFSGRQYIPELNTKDEEAIYLTTDSAVTVASVGSGGIADTGIENSVRVAFAQIGRVEGTTTTDTTITGINCVATEEGEPGGIQNGVTGICRKAQIWEPNDTDHVAGAISWYNKSCRARSKEDVTDTESYSGECNTISDGAAYKTYAIKNAIGSGDNVDIYDGEDYNKYENTTLLEAYPYFTDTMKVKTGMDRPVFMTLSPNSITKIRVYIYIEGQDIDNYNFAQIGKKVSIQFGFTKERFVDTDFGYTGPAVDLDRPVITLEGDNPLTLTVGSTFEDPGFTATDAQDGTITDDVVVDTSELDTSKAGTYRVTYSVEDSSGNKSALITRFIIVEEN